GELAAGELATGELLARELAGREVAGHLWLVRPGRPELGGRRAVGHGTVGVVRGRWAVVGSGREPHARVAVTGLEAAGGRIRRWQLGLESACGEEGCLRWEPARGLAHDLVREPVRELVWELVWELTGRRVRERPGRRSVEWPDGLARRRGRKCWSSRERIRSTGRRDGRLRRPRVVGESSSEQCDQVRHIGRRQPERRTALVPLPQAQDNHALGRMPTHA
ncbi:MAG TPA: hypothetical protein VIS06_05705, partial [Mycobacteriales bacterium]